MGWIYWNHELETKPWAEVEAWQAERIAGFVSRLPARSDFYRSHLGAVAVGAAGIRSLDALDALPFTAKDQLRRAQSQSETGRPFGANQAARLVDIVQAVSSSGTTGDPMFYALTRRDLDVWSDGIANVFFTCGVRPEDVVAHLVGLPMVAGGLPYADGFRRIGATLAWFGGFPTERILTALPRLQVSAILATTSFGVYLSDHCRKLIGCAPSELGVRKFLSGGEPGLGQPEIRGKISAAWGTSHIRECMGIGDVMSALWGECEEGSGMHFNAQRSVAVELIDPATGARIPWRDGAEGEAVYTTFEREATPALRYRSADHVVVMSTSCACGRTSPKIRCIGRTDDMLIYKAMNVFPSAIRDIVLSKFSDVVEPYMRIWKDRVDQVRFDEPIPLEIELRPGIDSSLLSKIGQDIEVEVRNRLQVRIRTVLVEPGTIPRSAYKTALVHVRRNQTDEM
jgi:phenylacetate-coenzyme A ligase PaaK-like adenylate-forming protein